ncbi:MAG: Holliday junction branch migration protein RuvA [Bacilli bacterium]|nr:Holliday junction branch migration protein RuvA [Bacilli bacterium]MDD4298202.1 Holliday junction branch migration protein RuvA [Bacilli bacterium]
MYDYIYGKVTGIESNHITLDNNGIGYAIFVPNPYSFHENEFYTIYIYQHIREDELSLYGFKSKEEKKLFLRLIGVKGLGPKIALPIFATGSINGIIDAIERENILYLTKFPKIGDKLARQIILDLKGKLVPTLAQEKTNEELVLVLESLGYKSSNIKKIISEVDSEKPIEEQVKDALKLLLK